MHRNKEIEAKVISDNLDVTNIEDIRIKCCEREYTASGLYCYKEAGQVDDTTEQVTKCHCLYSTLSGIDEFIKELATSKVITKVQALKYTLDYTPAERLLMSFNVGGTSKFSVNAAGEII